MGEVHTVDITKLSQLKEWVQNWAPSLGEKHLVLLEGPVGVGKTQLVRYVCDTLQISGEEVASPSYAIHHRYEGAIQSLDHVDLYRLESEEDLESTGFWDLFIQKKGYIFIEWADFLDYSFLPGNWPKTRLRLAFQNGSKRTLEWQNTGSA